MENGPYGFDETPPVDFYENSVNEEMLLLLRVPSHNVEAEQSVLGGLMLDPDAWESVCELLEEDDFYRADHRLIWRGCAALLNKGVASDPVTLSEALGGDLKAAGGLSYIGMLARNTPSSANIVAYSRIVKDRAVRRAIQAEMNTLNRMLTENRPTAEVLEHGAVQLTSLSIGKEGESAKIPKMNDLLAKVVDGLDYRFNNPGILRGLPTPWGDFNEATQGLVPGDLIIVAGRPSMGKTAFAMNMAEHCAVESKKPTVVFSMEMPDEALVLRSLSSLGRVDFGRLMNGRMQDDDWPKFAMAVGKLSDAPLLIDDQGALSPMELRARARRLAREHGGLGLIVIDYLQLMQVPGFKENRTAEITEISRSLKALAKELNVPVVALSQLNRSLEQRPNKRPVMSDLRESGAIEQDADLIIFIYRDEVYNPQSEDKGTAEIIIGKQRNGPIGTHRLVFLGKHQRFEDCAWGYDSPSSGTAASYRDLTED